MTTKNYALPVTILRLVDDGFPGWVECQFTDAAGSLHTIVDKYPLLTPEILEPGSQYPQPGAIPCEVLSNIDDSGGGELVNIRMPGIESTVSLSEFVVLRQQLVPRDPASPSDQ